jgi:hypothetical protein
MRRVRLAIYTNGCLRCRCGLGQLFGGAKTPVHHRGRIITPHQHSAYQQPQLIYPFAVVESLLLQFQMTMAAPEVHHLFHHPIADHSFSADRETLAVARENNVDLYARSGGGFKLQDELTGHDKTVTGVDIAPNSGKIVTCSQGELGASSAFDPAANKPQRP